MTDSTGSTVARGVLRLPLRVFISELRSLYSLDNGRPCLDFLSFPIDNITSYFFAPFRPLQQPRSATDMRGYYNKPTPKSVILTTRDGVNVPLK
jgi:hypothetical protein